MGGLIQTKGTQRLQKLFNDRFKGANLSVSRIVTSSKASDAPPVCSLRDAFKNESSNLLAISDRFIAQYANTSWPTDFNDYLYPSATLIPTNPPPVTDPPTKISTLQFKLAPGAPATAAGIPSFIAQGAPVSNLIMRGRIPKDTVVGAVTPDFANRAFSVSLVTPTGVAVLVEVIAGEMISFAKNKHSRLVRRWRWYLQHDLTDENHAAIRKGISLALEDDSFRRINFQAIEDKQRVLVTFQQKYNENTEELDDEFHMFVLLLTEATTAPEQLDPQ